jgi:hypothetical protein
MKLKSLADLQSPTPSGVGLLPAALADKTRLEMEYNRWNRQDAIRSKLLAFDRRERDFESNSSAYRIGDSVWAAYDKKIAREHDRGDAYYDAGEQLVSISKAEISARLAYRERNPI